MSSGEDKRVGAILGADEETVRFFGYGVYVGEFVPDESVLGLGKVLRSNNITNPKIVLDDGKVVWGCECWWGHEEEVEETLAKYKNVEMVDIDEIRKESNNNN